MKKILIVLILLFTFSGGYVVAESVNGSFEGNPIVKVLFGGKELIASDTPAIIYRNRTMVPLSLLKQAGFDVTWNQNNYSVSLDPSKPKLSKDDILKMKDGIGIIYCYDASGKRAFQGTAFVINQTELITAHHVTEGCSKLSYGNEEFTQGNIDDAFVDYFGIKISQSVSLKYSTTLPNKGDHVYALGYPHGVFSMTDGYVTELPTSRGITFIHHSANTDNGQSGGILVSDYGEVIGVTTGGYITGTTIAEAAPMMYIQRELDKVKN